jgi:hypothetical protein
MFLFKKNYIEIWTLHEKNRFYAYKLQCIHEFTTLTQFIYIIMKLQIFHKYKIFLKSRCISTCFLDFVGHFWDFITRYSQSVIFATTNHSFFLDFISYFWDFVTRYSDSVIFAIVTQSFFRFHYVFLRFRRVQARPFCYSDSIIFVILLVIFIILFET